MQKYTPSGTLGLENRIPKWVAEFKAHEFNVFNFETSRIEKLKVSDAIADIFTVFNQKALICYFEALRVYNHAYAAKGVPFVTIVHQMDLEDRILLRTDRLRINIVKDFESLPVDVKRQFNSPMDIAPAFCIGKTSSLHDEDLNEIYFVISSLEQQARIVDSANFIVLHELVHIVEPCWPERISFTINTYGMIPKEMQGDVSQIPGHCQRYKYQLLLLSYELKFVRDDIFEKLKGVIQTDMMDPYSWQDDVIEEIRTQDSNERFRLKSESASAPRSNFSNAKLVDLEGVVSFDGEENLFKIPTEDNAVVFLENMISRAFVDGAKKIDLNQVGLYLCFLEEEGIAFFKYVSPTREIITVNFAEAYWLLQ